MTAKKILIDKHLEYKYWHKKYFYKHWHLEYILDR